MEGRKKRGKTTGLLWWKRRGESAKEDEERNEAGKKEGMKKDR